MNPHLFVYGSLLSGEGHEMGGRLSREAQLVGPARLPGRLYAVSWYPGVVESREPGDIVHGEVLLMATPEATLAWLDAYEGIAPDGRPGEYWRVERAVALGDGTALTAWVYLYQLGTTGKRRIASGRWGDRHR